MKRIIALLCVILTSILAPVVVLASVQIANTNDVPRPDREWGVDPLLELPHLPDSADSDPDFSHIQTTSGSFDSLAPWSKITFQSYRDGNWEIYLANGAGQNAVRLTNHPATDAYPRLNRGATQIVFASNRDGDYEIYAMNVNGSGLRQLTVNSATDTRPVWSPDGTKIAFQSYRDGIAEIYLMNADGSGQTRLTTDGTGSIHPAWSPDGTKIAFASIRGGSYAIWTMNPNGSGAQQVGAARTYAEHPVWSANGSQIAFDADADGDGFQELWTMNADGSSQAVVYDPYGQTDAWAASWTPDIYGVPYVGITEISFVFYQGNWYWTYAYLRARNPGCYWCTSEPIGATDVDWHPAWQTTDVQPPVANFYPLPQYSRCSNTQVAWAGYDVGTIQSGFYAFDTQYREGSGNWADWLSQTWLTTATFSGTCGQEVQFRVRGQDRAGNHSGWTADSAAPSTRLYAYFVSGNLLDSRDASLPGATFAITPTPVGIVDSQHWGSYIAYLQQPGDHETAISKPGYGGLPTSTLGITQDRVVDWYLPPADDLISNGHFEDNGGSLAGWQMSDITPTITLSTWHSGKAASSLAASLLPSFTAPEVLTGGLGTDPDLAVGSDGVVHVVYHQLDGIYYTRRDLGGTWSVPQKIDVGNVPPFIAVTPSGEVNVVWSDGYGVYHRSLPAGGTWSEPARLEWAIEPDIAADAQGGVHVVYQYVNNGRQTVAYRYRPNGGDWQPARIVLLARDPRIAVDSANRAHIVAHYVVNPTTMRYCSPYGEYWTCGNEFYGVDAAQIAIDPQGNVHLIWTDSSSMEGRYAYKSINDAFNVTALPNYRGRGEIDSDSHGNLFVVNTDGMGTHLQIKPANSEWMSPVLVDQAQLGIPVIAVDSSDRLNVIYEAEDTTNRFVRSSPSITEARSSLHQTLTLPTILHGLTLSWLWRLQSSGANLTDPMNGFTVSILHAADEPVVFSTTAQSLAWAHAWMDMSPWAGQTITIELAARTTQYLSTVQVDLDEISLGSWLTPIISDVSPTQVEPWISTSIIITGENFIATPTVRISGTLLTNILWVNENTMQATLPTGVAPGRYDMWVTNPGGQENILPGALQVGKLVYLPVVTKQYLQ